MNFFVSLIASVAGALFCLFQSAGIKLPCLTAGCEIYASYSFLGISFYNYGAAGFLLLAAVILYTRRRPSKRLVTRLVAAGLMVNSGFLVYQVLYWRCTSCEVAALFLGLTAAPMLMSRNQSRSSLIRPCFYLWAVLFLIVGVQIVKESALRPWVIYGNPQASVQVYFSPTCPTCQITVQDMLARVPNADGIAFIPVAKSDEDRRRVASLVASQGLPCTDINALFEPVSADCSDSSHAEVIFGLERNKMILAGIGSRSVPVVVVNGQVPAMPDPARQYTPGFLSPAETLQGCGFTDDEDCLN